MQLAARDSFYNQYKYLVLVNYTFREMTSRSLVYLLCSKPSSCLLTVSNILYFIKGFHTRTRYKKKKEC